MSMNELPKKPSELIERLTNETDLNWRFKSEVNNNNNFEYLYWIDTST